MRVQRRHRPIIGAGLAALSLLALAACGNGAATAAGDGSSSSGSSGGAYNVVLISDLSGDFSSVSAPGAAGAEVAVDNINASGGVNGKKLNLQVLDSQSSASMALAAAQKAIAENPLTRAVCARALPKPRPVRHHGLPGAAVSVPAELDRPAGRPGDVPVREAA